MHSKDNSPTFAWQHLGVIALGVLVFVLLLFANKTNLDNDVSEGVMTGGRASDNTSEVPQTNDVQVPEVENEALAAQLAELETTTDKDRKIALLKDIVEGLQNEGKFGLAADYASRLAGLVPTADNHLVAGALYRFSSQQEGLAQGDSALFRARIQQAIGQLEKSLEIAPQNEGAMIELGLAYIESGQPGTAMQGIMKIREVTEINPKNAEAAFHLGIFSYDTGQYDKAEGRFKTVLELDPNNLVAKYYLGLVNQELGNSRAFIDIMKELAAQQQDAVIAERASSILEKNKK